MQWPENRIKAFIVSVLRSGTRRWPPRYESLEAAKTEKKINELSGRMAQHYRCNICKEEFTNSHVEVDHIDPIVPLSGFTTWDEYIKRMFCGAENLQVLCKPCHKIKTHAERKPLEKKNKKKK